MKTLLIYGATGYTGRMAAERAKALGLNFEIAGRTVDEGRPGIMKNSPKTAYSSELKSES